MKKQILIFGFAMLLSVAGAFAQHVDGGTTGPLTWELTGTGNNLTLTINGEGAMPDYELPPGCLTTAPWASYRESITTVVIENGVTSIGDWAFASSSSILCVGYSVSSITIPNSVTDIGKGAFCSCVALQSITIPSGVTTIGESAFSECKSLVSITLPNSLKTIGENAFSFCTALESVTIPNSVTTIGGVAFGGCKALESITIPNSITTIGNRTFTGCTALASVTIPNSVTTIEWAFLGCTALKSIDIPNSVTTIEGAFYGCTALEAITIPNSVTTIGSETFAGCTSLASITIPNSVTTIGGGAFQGCTALASITIPNSVTTIEEWTFASCTSLVSITIPSGVTTIGRGSFSECTALTSIAIPSGVTTIGQSAFYGCTALTSITNLNPVPVEISSYVFENVDQSACTLTVPTSAVSAYKNAAIWQEFNIVGGGILVYPKSDNPEHGYVTGNDLYEGRATATVTATAYSGYKFVNWTKDGVEVSTDNPYSFTVTEDIELVANFEEGVGIVETLRATSLQVYPNPTTGELWVDTMTPTTITNIEIFDVMGRAVHVETRHATSLQSQIVPPPAPSKGGEFRTSPIEMNISHLPTGIYFLRIATDEGVVVRKVVKE